MDIAILIEKLTFADNIYDLVGIAYEYIIEVGEVDACRKFKEKSEEVRNVENDLIGPIFQYSEGIITFETVRENFVKMIKSNLLDYDIICVLLVQIFDRFYEYKTNETYEFKIKHAVGPLNNVTYSEKVLIYTKPVETFIKEINNKAKFRRIIPYDASSINEVLKLQKYILLKASNFDNYPRVSKYIDNGFFKECLDNENKIKIGVVPFCGFEAVKVKTIGETFFIDGPKEELISNIVDRYIKIIKKMIDDGINIAVFPELILIEESYNVIRDYLKKTPQDELKLIFCGSQWKKNSNVLFVITGNGNELMKYYKKTPFDYTVNNKVYTESLIPHEDIVEMIDIDSLGRIIPTICKDYLNQSYIGQLKHALHCNFAVVSAYSPSVTAFTTTSSEFSQNSHGISVICNCCEPVIKDRENFNHDIGYISLPMKANTSVKTQENYYCYNSGCSSSCKDNICYAKYELYNNSILTDGLNKSIKVEQSIVKIPL